MKQDLTESKKSGVVFTPSKIVTDMINISCNSKSLYKIKILEHSFGEGAFLLTIVQLIIKQMRDENKENSEIIEVLENKIFGIEINRDFYNKTIDLLNKLVIREGIEKKIRWNLYCENSLQWYIKNGDKKFDLVIGNPPYVRIHNIEKKEKEILNQFKLFNRGMYDLYLFFIEISINLLEKDGESILITPKSWLTSKAGEKLRKKIIDEKLLKEIYDLSNTYMPFKASTYTMIFKLKNKKNNKVFYYKYDKQGNINYINKNGISFFTLDKKIYLHNNEDIFNISSVNKKNQNIFVRNGFATLNDKIFINKNFKFKNSIPVYKASIGKYSRIIYPYTKKSLLIDIETIKINEKQLYEYLVENKNDLKRDALKINWWEFGRTQAINDTYKPKIAINNLFKSTKDVKLKLLEGGVGIYSGFYIYSNVINIKELFEKIENLCNSKNFIKYVQIFGSPRSGGYFTISSVMLQNYINSYLI